MKKSCPALKVSRRTCFDGGTSPSSRMSKAAATCALIAWQHGQLPNGRHSPLGELVKRVAFLVGGAQTAQVKQPAPEHVDSEPRSACAVCAGSCSVQGPRPVLLFAPRDESRTSTSTQYLACMAIEPRGAPPRGRGSGRQRRQPRFDPLVRVHRTRPRHRESMSRASRSRTRKPGLTASHPKYHNKAHGLRH